MTRWARTGLLAVVATSVISAEAASQVANGLATPPPTLIYFVRHGETVRDDPRGSLDAVGLARASELAGVMSRVPLTHVFASHTFRSRQAVAPAAESHGLGVVPLPPLGTEVDGQTVGDVSPSRLAIAPLAERLAQLPAGSVALVGVNSDNIFAILNELGVPLSTPDACTLGETCVPCLSNQCFPREFDNLWLLVFSNPQDAPVLHWLKY